MKTKVNEVPKMNQYQRHKYETATETLKRKAEIKREFQEYMDESCSKYKRAEGK